MCAGAAVRSPSRRALTAILRAVRAILTRPLRLAYRLLHALGRHLTAGLRTLTRLLTAALRAAGALLARPLRLVLVAIQKRR